MFAPSDLFSVRGRTALVTGGATGLGRVCAEALLAAGRAGAYRLAQGRGLRGGGEGAVGDRPLRGLRRNGRDRGGRRRTRGRDAQAHRRAAYSRQQRRHDLGQSVRDLPLEGVRPDPQRQRDRALRAHPRTRADAVCFRDRRAAVQRRQFRLGDGDHHPVGNRLFLRRLQGRRPSSDPHSGGRIRRPAGDGQRDRARARFRPT